MTPTAVDVGVILSFRQNGFALLCEFGESDAFFHTDISCCLAFGCFELSVLHRSRRFGPLE
jgi:hypothetical protein